MQQMSRIDLELNKGENKYHPEGLKCNFRKKEVDCLAFALESGGITGAILVYI